MAAAFGVALTVVHVGLLGCWLGSMLYSMLVVQPRAARYFGSDDDAHEAFLVTLGAGNRRRVLAVTVPRSQRAYCSRCWAERASRSTREPASRWSPPPVSSHT